MTLGMIRSGEGGSEEVRGAQSIHPFASELLHSIARTHSLTQPRPSKYVSFPSTSSLFFLLPFFFTPDGIARALVHNLLLLSSLHDATTIVHAPPLPCRHRLLLLSFPLVTLLFHLVL